MSSILAITYDGTGTVTLSDTAIDPAGPFAGLIVTATGTLKFRDLRGGDTTLSSTTEGQIIPIAVARVWNTGTSATVRGLYAMPYKGTNPAAQ
jgi:hypothetical protein